MNAILDAREKRSEHIKQLIASHQEMTLAVLKLNVVGEEKNPSHLKFICLLFHKHIQDEFGHKIIKYEKVSSLDGDYMYYVINEKGMIVKERTIYIEEHNYFGRLVDIDIYSSHGISRSDLKCEMRKCILCDNYAHICSRNQTHSNEEIHMEIRRMVDDLLPKMIFNEVLSSIYYELDIYPRFGLVGKVDSGIHKDMNFNTFIESVYAIKPYIKKYIEAGLYEIDPLQLKEIGKQAEQAMFRATNGVNTQKGLIFGLGIFLPALVKTILENKDILYLQTLMQSISKEIIGDYFENISLKDNFSHGDRIYINHGMKGIRGEALKGFPLLFEDVPNIDGGLKDPYEYLLFFMSKLDDTTIIHRQGIDKLRDVQKEIRAFILKGGYHQNKQEYIELSKQYQRDGISPGGSSDLLVLKLIFENLQYLLLNQE